MANPSSLLRSIPSVNELLDSPPLRGLVERVNRNVVVTGVRGFLDRFREEVKSRAEDLPLPTASELAERIASWISATEPVGLRRVINATGLPLHTGLGRAPLADEALQAVCDVSRGYSNLEVDIATGERSQRVAAVEPLLNQLLGSEAAVVVNNNAAATLLVLTALSHGKEAVVSRGHLIEIGGNFRLPEVMTASGARLREVGTTNKTRLSDFAQAIGPETGVLLKVHPSNYVVCGFTEQPTLEELVELGRRRGVPVIDDIGSGAIDDFAAYGLHDEPTAKDSLRAGADVCLFSGDKLLGGPQCGIIVGKRELLAKIANHPLMRALRVDKMTLAALAATLKLHLRDVSGREAVPLIGLLATSTENLRNRAERLAPQLAASAAVAAAEAVAGTTFLGGGSVPTQEIPTWCVALRPVSGSVDELAARLRKGEPSVFGRIQRDRLLLDLRAVLPREDVDLVAAVTALTPLP
ncbi:MAG TPA: L-seryl-tRNA(Sec) selenium transferase [Pirellulaceae bacterium]|nr:L-seryl-tRNA(Sec) selenium transferase [Pirellulaceae bacterium]